MERTLEELMDFHNPPGEGWSWYSICSRHGVKTSESQTDCSACMKGHWVNDEEHAADVKLHHEDYDAWYAKHNAPNSETLQFLKAVFPNANKS
jgi:hypothetical protein